MQGFNIALGIGQVNSAQAIELSTLKNYGFIDVHFAGKKLTTRPCTQQDEFDPPNLKQKAFIEANLETLMCLDSSDLKTISVKHSNSRFRDLLSIYFNACDTVHNSECKR